MSEATTQETRHWLQKIVIGLNLCPFAKKEFDDERVHIRCSSITDDSFDDEKWLLELEEEWQRLDNDATIGTTLLVYPECFTDFDNFLGALGLAEELLRVAGYEGVYQLASFHPHYRFEGSEADDAANYTNRSPYPMLHLLREAELSRVLKRYPDPAQIPIRNQQVCRDLGTAGLLALLS